MTSVPGGLGAARRDPTGTGLGQLGEARRPPGDLGPETDHVDDGAMDPGSVCRALCPSVGIPGWRRAVRAAAGETGPAEADPQRVLPESRACGCALENRSGGRAAAVQAANVRGPAIHDSARSSFSASELPVALSFPTTCSRDEGGGSGRMGPEGHLCARGCEWE